MEDIEYLEEYEDLVLPALNSAAAASATASSGTTKSFENYQNQKVNDAGEDSSSSLDQDIFNCLFDDNSDDDDENDFNTFVQQGDGKIIKTVEILEQDRKSQVNTFDKEINKPTSSTPKPKTYTTKSSSTTVSINRAQQTFVNKPKSVATVRPTVQNQLHHAKQKKVNTVQRSTASLVQQQQQQRPTTSTSPTQLPISARKPLSSATASTSALVSKNTTPVNKFIKRPATIVKPEKIIIKDPVNDPLNLDDLSEAGSDNYSFSDISGETYNTISEFEEDESNGEYYSGGNNDYDDDDNISSSSQIIELSNDSTGSRSKLEVFRASTPSPVISDDSDTSTSSFDLKLKKSRSTKPYSHAVIIESVLRKGAKPKLLELLKLNNLLDDSADNESEEETNVVIDITASKENLSEILGVNTVKRQSPSPVDANIVENISLKASNSAIASTTSSDNKDKNKTIKKKLKKMDRSNTSRESTDSDLSAVEELLEESYAEAMKRLKDMPLNNQEVGAELEIGGEEEVTSIEIVKQPEDKSRHTKPGIVIDYDDNPLEEESANLKESKEMSMLELIEMIEREQNERKNEKVTVKTSRDVTKSKHIDSSNTPVRITTKPKNIDGNPHSMKDVTEKIESSTLKQKEIVKDTQSSKEVVDNNESSTSKQYKANKETPSSQEATSLVTPESNAIKSTEIVEQTQSKIVNTASNDSLQEVTSSATPESNAIKSTEIVEETQLKIVNKASTDSPNARKKKRFRNLNTPEPSEPKNDENEIHDFIGFEEAENLVGKSNLPVVENASVEKADKTIVEKEKSNEKPIECSSIEAKAESSGSFKSPTSSHKSLQDKHKDTREKHVKDSSKDRMSKESKPKTSFENSKEKSCRENSKERNSRDNSKDRSRESSKDRTKSYNKDSDTKYHKEHRKSNDSKESSRSRESSKSRDSKHSRDKRDKSLDRTKEKAPEKTKATERDIKDKKDSDNRKKDLKEDKHPLERKGDIIQHKKSTEDINKKASSTDKDAKNISRPKESKDASKVSSSKSGSSCSSSREPSKDRKDIKKPTESSNKNIAESKKSEVLNKSPHSVNQNKPNRVVANTGTKIEPNKTSSSTKDSNKEEKHADKLKSSKKSIDSLNDSTKSVKSDVKPNKDSNTNLKATSQKPIDAKSIDLKNKIVRDKIIVKNVTPSKSTNQSPDNKNVKDKSNTSVKAVTKEIILAKSKDSNNKNIKENSINKNETPSKTTTQISDKAISSKIATSTTDANKTTKKVTEDKRILPKEDANKTVISKQSDKNVDPNKKSNVDVNKSVKIEDPNKKSSPVGIKAINKITDPNKKSTADGKKPISKIEEKSETSKVQASVQGDKNTKSITTNKLSKEDSSNSLKKNLQSIKDTAQITDANKPKVSPSKSVLKKPNENKQKEKSDITKTENLQKQDSKTSLKTNSEELKSKEIKNKPDDKKSDKSVSLETKKEFKSNPDTKIKPENIDKNKDNKVEELAKTIKPKPDNESIKKTLDARKIDTNIEGKPAPISASKEKNEAINIKQSKETVEAKTLQKMSVGKSDTIKTNKTEKSSVENVRETKLTPSVSEPDLKPKVVNKELNVKNIESKQSLKLETKTDSTKEIKESLKLCDKKEDETKCSKEGQLQLETNTKQECQSMSTVTTSNTEIKIEEKQIEIPENISTEKDDSETTQTKTSIIPNKTDKIAFEKQDVSKDTIEPKESDESSSIQETNKNEEMKEISKDNSNSKKKSKVLSPTIIIEETTSNINTQTESSPNISVQPIKEQQTDKSIVVGNNEKEEEKEQTDNPIEPRVTRSRMEISKTNENIEDEPEETILKPRITRQRVNNALAESTIDVATVEQSKMPLKTKNRVDIKTDNSKLKDCTSIVKLVDEKHQDEENKEKAKKEISSVEAENELESKIGEEKSSEKNNMQVVETIKSDKLGHANAEDENSIICETPLNKTETIDETQAESNKLKTEDLKEHSSDIKTDSKVMELHSEIINERAMTPNALKKEKSESNIIATRTRKRAIVKVDEKKLEEKNSKDGKDKPDGQKREPEKTTEVVEEANEKTDKEKLQTKTGESTELPIKDKIPSVDQTKHTEKETSQDSGNIDLKGETKHAVEETIQDDGKADDNKVEPKRTRNRADIKKQTESSTELFKVDKNESKDQINKDIIKENCELETTEKDNFGPILTRKCSDVRVQESAESSVKDKTSSKDQKCEQIIETGGTGKQIEKENVIEAKNTDDDNFEPIRTRRRVEIKATAVNDCTTKIQTNEEILEPVKTRKRAEEINEISEAKAGKDNSDNVRTRSRTEVIENDLKQKIGAELSGKDKRNLKDQAIEETKETTKMESEKADENKFEPIRTRKRLDVKSDKMKQTESTELLNENRTDPKDPDEDVIEPIITRKRLEETSAVGVKKTDDTNSENIRTRKRAAVKADDSKETDENDVCETELESLSETKNIESDIDKTFEDNFEPIKTRKRVVELKRDDSNVSIPKQTTESDTTQVNKIKDPEEEKLEVENIQVATKLIKKQVSDPTQITENTTCDAEAEKSLNNSTITTDNTIKRILRKRGSESPFSENENKKIFKEPSTKAVLVNTPKSSAKSEKPLTNVTTVSSLKRSLRSPVSEPESLSTAKRSKLEIPRKTTTRFRNLHDDCLEEEELPVINAGVSVVGVNELNNVNVEPKEVEVQENKKSLRKETLEKKTTEQLDKKPTENDVVREKVSVKQIKVNKNTGGKEIEKSEEKKSSVNVEKTISSNQTVQAVIRSEETKTKALNNEKPLNNEKLETKKQNTPDRNKINKSKVDTPINKSSGLSSVLSFSDWLKTKEKSTVVEDNPGQSPNSIEISNVKTKGKSTVKAKPTAEVVEIGTATKDNNAKSKETDKSQEKESLVCNQQKQKGGEKKLTQEKQETSNISTKTTLLQSSEENTMGSNKIENMNKASQKKNANKKIKNKQNKGENTSITADTSKTLQPDVREDKSFDSKVKVDNLKCSTPISTKQKNKKSEIDLLIESMSKEMKDGGINDLLNADTHVKRQRLSSKRNFTGSAEHLNTSSHITTREPIATTTVGSVLSKEMPKVIDFADSTEIVSSLTPPTTRELSKSPSKRKIQQNTTKTNKANAHKNTAETIVPDKSKSINVNTTTSIKSRKSYNPKELTTQNKPTETLSAPTAIKLRKSMPQIKVFNLARNEAAGDSTPQSKARKSVPFSINKEKIIQTDNGANENGNKIFKAPKPVIQSTLLNLIPNQDNIAKLYAEENKSPQSRNKTKSTNVVKMFKCRDLKIRLDRSKVRKYLSTLNERSSKVYASSENNLQSGAESARFSENSHVIQNNADSNLRIQSVVNTAHLMDLSTDYNLNNVFVPQDCFNQTSAIPSTIHLGGSIPPSITPASISLADQPYVGTQILESLPMINSVDPHEHIELKHEFMDENPIDLVNEALLPDTPTLLARAQTITEAAHHALSSSITPTDIRLMNTESTENAFVPSFGVTPTVLDNKGTCMYTFLHPAKYNRNHSNVLLDYCCPNLDGPMPAIDPTRIHSQVQLPVIELPASIVLTTKVVTRADLERENSNIPGIIRRKAEKIRNNLAAHHKVATQQQPTAYTTNITQTQPPSQSSPPGITLPPTINALTKQLPSTTTITAKIRPTQHQENVLHLNPISNPSTTDSALTTIPNIPTKIISVIPKGQPQLSQVQKSSLRSNLRRFDVLLKQLVQPYDNLTFVDRHRIIEAIIATGKVMPKDLERTITLLEEYINQVNILNNDKTSKQPSAAPIPLPSTTTNLSTNNYNLTTQSAAAIQMPQLQPSPSLLASTSAGSNSSSLYCRQQLEEIQRTTVKKVQNASRTTSSNVKETSTSGAVVKQRQVPIYDTERNIIGYQMKSLTPMATMPAYTKSTMSTHTGTIMSTSLDSSNNKTTSFSISKRPMKRPAQDSPRVFYTTPPLQTSTPKAITNPTPVYPRTASKQNTSKTIAQKTQKGSVVTTLRSAGGSSSSGNSETITTTTMATLKRVTRSTATGSKIIIVSKSNQSSEESILPDTNNQEQPEIKNEKDIEDFIG